MNPFDALVSERFCVSLLHSLWQAPLCALIAWTVSRCIRGRDDIAYVVHTLALAVALIAVPATCLMLPAETDLTTQSSVAANSGTVATAITTVSPKTLSPTSDATLSDAVTTGAPVIRPSVPSVSLPGVNEPGDSADPVTLAESPMATPQNRWTETALQPAIPWLVGLYLTGVTLMLLRLVRSAISADRLRARAQCITQGPAWETLDRLCKQGARSVTPVLAHAEHVAVPQIVGLLRPAVLLPSSALTGLSAGDLELILAHELAHLRRHDLWVNLFQRFVEAILFFNPGVWWLSRRISTLREYCCDDQVCATLPQPNEGSVRYAAALLHAVELSKQIASPKPFAPSAYAQLSSLAAAGHSPSELRRRVTRLFGQPVREPMPLSAGSVLAGLLIVLGTLLGPAIWEAQGQTDESSNQQADESDRWLRVCIVGPDGNPIPELEVEVRRLPEVESRLRIGDFVKKQRYGTVVQSDPAGKIALDLRDQDLAAVELFVREPGYGPYYARWSRRLPSELWSSDVTLELEKAWSIGGVVVDAKGTPIAGATVQPSLEYKRRPGDNGQLGVGRRFKTDENGVWRFDSVPISKDELTVEIMHPEYSSTLAALGRETYEVAADSVPTQSIAMTKGLSVTGRVVDESGTPIEGATIRTEQRNDLRTATTDRDGNYRLVGCQPMTSRLVVSAPGKALDMKEVVIQPDMLPVNFKMQPGGTIRIRVVDEDGKGIPKARIFFQKWRGHIDYFEFDHIQQYANGQGVWEWNEAPLDVIEADICRPGGMQLTNQTLQARKEAYVFSPPTMLTVTGKVTDAETGDPIEVFQAIQGEIRDQQESKVWWEDRDPFRATEGSYRVQFNRVGAAAKVRIEAPGYQVALSRDIQRNEGELTLDFALKRQSSVAATLLTPDGQPATEADIAMGIKGAQIAIDNGRFTSQTYAQRLTTDKTGRFEFPDRDAPLELVILHPTGFAHIKSSDGPIPEQIKLTPWARVEGIYQVGKQPLANISISCSGGIHAGGSDRPSIFTFTDVKTDASGRYVFDRVFPGQGRVGREIVRIVNQGFREKFSSTLVPYEVKAGQRLQLNIGGSGRAVVGRLAASKTQASPVSWNFGELVLTPGGPEPKWPDVPAEFEGDAAKQRQWYAEWSETPPGKALIKRFEEWEAARESSASYRATVGSDGAFRIDDVPPGDYMLECRDHYQKLPGTLKVPVTVPSEDENEASDTDLGVLTLLESERQ